MRSVIAFCPVCFWDCINVDDRCHRCNAPLKGSLTIPGDAVIFGSGNVVPWALGDPGTPTGTVVAVDGDAVTVEVGGAAVEVFREVEK